LLVVSHPDPCALEAELLARVDAAHPVAGPGRTVVLVPTSRLAAHVQRRLAGVRRAWVGVEVLTFRGLAWAALEAGGASVPRLLSPALRRAAVARLVRERPRNAWAGFAASRPGVVGRLAATLDELREAGVEPAALGTEAGDLPRDRALAELYEAWTRWLEQLGRDGVTDEAGLVRRAAAHVERWAGGCGAAFLHGAYELTGVQLDLVRAVDAHAPLAALVPVAEGAPVSEFAARFARRHLAPGSAIAPIERAEGCGLALAALFDERARPRPAPPERLAFRTAQGAADELRAAVRHALAAVEAGCPPEEVAIVARTLAPYAAAAEEVLDDGGLRWTSSLASALGRVPRVADFLRLLAIAGDDFPRRPTAAALASPRVDWRALAGGAAPVPGHRADPWSRRAGIVGGLDEWTQMLPRWAAETRTHRDATESERAEARERARDREADARRIADALGGLARRIAPEARGAWSEHAERLRSLLADCVRPSAAGSAFADAEAELEAVLDDLARQETLLGDRRAVPFSEARAWVEAAVESRPVALREVDLGGLRVLDAMQARGLTFRRVFLVGLNAGTFPRPVRDDPVLGHDLRARLGRATGRPLPSKSDGALEERLLLSLVVGAARERTDVSWQRADETGRVRVPSLALRELARLAVGRPAPERIAAGTIPSHPAHALAATATDPGLLGREEAVLLAALSCPGPERLDELEAADPSLAAPIRMLRATETFGAGDPAYDGRLGPGRADGPVAVTAFETLGRCPLQHFFTHLLRVREPDEEADPYEAAPREIGERVHEVLASIYATLAEEGAFERGTAAERIERGLGLLAERQADLLPEAARRRAGRMPVLWEHAAEQWTSALAAFLRSDLRRIGERRLRVRELECACRGPVDLGEGVAIELVGRFDRVLDGPKGTVVGDYKTSGNLRRRVDPAAMLRGETLQVPLYALLAGAAEVELLGVGPAFDPEDEESRPTHTAFVGPRREAFLETLRTLADIRRRGVFPAQAGWHCSWCAHRLTCRRNHPPSEHREEAREDARAWRGLRRKNTQRPWLDDEAKP